MSVIRPTAATCPSCQASFDFPLADSINAGRQPQHRATLLDGTFQQATCPECKATFRAPPELTYLDLERAWWILVEPADRVAEWQALEGAANQVFATRWGERAPAPARRAGRGLRARVTFGWPALREKVLIAERGIDEIALELLKLTLVRDLDGNPLADDVELRMVDANEETLDLMWVRATTEEALETLRVPRALLTAIQPAASEWSALARLLTRGPYVDMNRVLVTPAEPTPAS